MAMSINRLMVADGASVYYTPEWMRMIESHLTYLRTASNGQIVQIEPALAYKYEGDLFGLLNQLKVRPQYHWTVMRLNDLTNSDQMTVDRTTLIFPDFKLIDKLTQTFQTSRKKIN